MPLNKKAMNSRIIEYVNLEELSKTDYKIISGEADITGWPVKDESENQIGQVRDLLFDPEQNAIRYIVVDLNPEVARDGEKAILIPIGFADLAEDKKEVVIPVLHQHQLEEMPQYIIGEVSRETENKIRTAIGSPAALRIEEEIVELDEHPEQFYQHHHFDRGRRQSKTDEVSVEENNSTIDGNDREEEALKIHHMVTDSNHETVHQTTEFTEHDATTSETKSTESFKINTLEGSYDIEPHENGTYRIMDGERKIGVIYPEAGEQGTQWKSMDEIGSRFITMIGEAITSHHSGASGV